eukprot:1599360-Alexandrium_andersonii.AAC.1
MLEMPEGHRCLKGATVTAHPCTCALHSLEPQVCLHPSSADATGVNFRWQRHAPRHPGPPF